MKTGLEGVDRQFDLQPGMQSIDIFTPLLAVRDIGLVGDHDVQKTGAAQSDQRRGNPGQQFEFGCLGWRVGFAISHQ